MVDLVELGVGQGQDDDRGGEHREDRHGVGPPHAGDRAAGGAEERADERADAPDPAERGQRAGPQVGRGGRGEERLAGQAPHGGGQTQGEDAHREDGLGRGEGRTREGEARDDGRREHRGPFPGPGDEGPGGQGARDLPDAEERDDDGGDGDGGAELARREGQDGQDRALAGAEQGGGGVHRGQGAPPAEDRSGGGGHVSTLADAPPPGPVDRGAALGGGWVSGRGRTRRCGRCGCAGRSRRSGPRASRGRRRRWRCR